MKKMFVLGALIALVAIIPTALAACEHHIKIEDACCLYNETYGWLYNISTGQWEYIPHDDVHRYTWLFNLSINQTYYYNALCTDIYTPVNIGDKYNASMYRAIPSCKNNSIAYILNNWILSCNDCDNVSAAQSAVWYFWYLNESACEQMVNVTDFLTDPPNSLKNESEGGSNWIPNCTEHPLACDIINESINKSVPYDVTVSLPPGTYTTSSTIEVTAEVKYCEGVDKSEVNVIFEVNSSNCQFVESGSQTYETTTQNGVAKANLTCSSPGDYEVDVTVEGAKWFKIVDPDACQPESYQATMALLNLTNSSIFSVEEFQQPTIETHPSTYQTTLYGIVNDTAILSVPNGQPKPTGTVTFYLCDPGNVTLGVGCEEGNGTYISTNPIVNGTATSNDVIIGVNVTMKTGTWCWGVNYSGDDNYSSQYYTDTSECFEVKFEQPTITTESSVRFTVFNESVYDVAYFTVPPGQPEPTGNVTFYLCDPENVTSQGCPQGSGYYISTNPIVNGTATSDPVIIGQDVPAKKGWWCWGVYYEGDANYSSQYHTNRNTECFFVDPHGKVPVLNLVGMVALISGILITSLILLRRR